MEQPTMKKDYDVFISHKTTEDGSIANRLVASLESRGLKCWIAPRDISAGQNYASAIVDGIRSSSVFLMLFSRYANESPDIVREVHQASSCKMPILTVRLDDAKFSPALSYFLSLPQGIGPFGRNETVFDGVFNQVKALLDGTSLPIPTSRKKPKRRIVPLLVVALVVAVSVVSARIWHGDTVQKPFPSTRIEEQTANEVLRVVGNLAAAYQCAAESRLEYINEALDSIDDPSVAESGALFLRKQLNDALDLLEKARPTEDAIAQLNDTPLDVAVYRALFDASKQEIENDLKTLPVTIPFYTSKDNPLSNKDKKGNLQKNKTWMELQSQFFALGVIELLLPVSPGTLAEFKKHAATYTAIPRLAQTWPPDKISLDIEQEAVMQRLQAIVTQLASVVGNENMDYSADRQKHQNTLREAGVTPEKITEIIGHIESEAAKKTYEKWTGKPSD